VPGAAGHLPAVPLQVEDGGGFLVAEVTNLQQIRDLARRKR
jgi:hypothetical protein